VPPELSLRPHGTAETLQLQDRILPVYAASHAPVIHDPWFSEAKFWDRLVQLYAPGRDFEMVSGWLDDELVGYAFGSPGGDTAATWGGGEHGSPRHPGAGRA
jgi:hypothetical protein